MKDKTETNYSYYLEELSTALRRFEFLRISELPLSISSHTDCSRSLDLDRTGHRNHIVRHSWLVGNHNRHRSNHGDSRHSDRMDCHNPDHNLHDDNHVGTEISKKIYKIL